MSGKWHGGKGDKPRKSQREDLYKQGWDRIFNKDDSQPKGDPNRKRPNRDAQAGYRVGDIHKT